MRGKDWERAAEVAVNELEKLSGFWGEGGRMRNTSVFPDDAGFTFRQLVARGERDAFD
jgi:hypothetical protein